MTEHRTEADAVAAIAFDAADPVTLEPGHVYAAPTGIATFNTDAYLEHPRRAVGTATLRDVDAFLAYTRRHLDEASTTLWGDADAGTVTAVFNDHGHNGDATKGAPGWRDHRAELRLESTPDWQALTGIDRKWLTRSDMAEFIEDRLIAFVDPAGADMLELAQSFQAVKKVSFEDSQRLSSGETTITYREDIDAKAGRKGSLSIPDRLTLALQPFVGGEIFKVGARFRYRLGDGELRLSIVLDRPDEVRREAFAAARRAIENEVGMTVLNGAPGR